MIIIWHGFRRWFERFCSGLSSIESCLVDEFLRIGFAPLRE